VAGFGLRENLLRLLSWGKLELQGRHFRDVFPWR
jgi:hypothetical protein